MISHIMMVAMREYRQIAATRGFWITLLILPIALAAGPIASKVLGTTDTERVMLIDADGRQASAIRSRIDIDEQRRVLTALSRYAARYDLDKADPAAIWARHDRLYSDADVTAFERSGGKARALAVMAQKAGRQIPAFETPEPWYQVIPTPPAIAGASPDRIDALLEPLLRPASKNGDRKPLHYALLVPADFGRGTSPVRLWANDQPRPAFVQLVQSVLTAGLRAGYLESSGLSAAQAQTAGAIVPAIAISTPPPGGGRERVVIRSILPLASAYVLLMALMLSGSWMLQGVVEERSNKLIETVLACISPNELMYGKLVGTVAIGLTMVLVWAACGIGAALATKGVVADVLRPALASVSSPWIVAAMLYYFIAGYVLFSMVFLAIGAMSDSMRDAQSYLTPVLLVIAMPFVLLAEAILRDTGSVAVTVMTWIPIYTPFTMLARLGVGVPAWEIAATSALLAATVALALVMLGRVFRASLLASGQKPTLAVIGRLMRRAPE